MVYTSRSIYSCSLQDDGFEMGELYQQLMTIVQALWGV